MGGSNFIRAMLQNVMNFFNKYKDLFGVPENAPIPKSKLSVNNNLFIDKPFVPTYQETLSINSKLRDLRKDYNQLEQEIESINVTMRSPKRAMSRKGKDLQEKKEKNMAPMASPEPQKTSPFLKLDRKKHNASMQNILNPNPPPQNLQPMHDPFAKKRMTWLKDQQVNLAKHAEMNYIFNHKIKEENQKISNMREVQLPKAENFMFGSNVNDSGVKIGARNDTFKPVNRTRVPEYHTNIDNSQVGMKKRQSNKGQLDYAGAVKRREQAKRNIKARRDKLGYLYRTSW